MKWDFKPIVLDPNRKSDAQRLRLLFRRKPPLTIADTLEDQRAELWESRLLPPNPLNSGAERWVYYPWRNVIVHALAPPLFQELRTSRNRNLITKEEQKKARSSLIAIAGLSVGNTIAAHLMLEGFENMHLADYDSLSLSNLNRLRASIADIGVPKTVLAARQLYEINPYARIMLFTRGIQTLADIERFAVQPRRAALIIDEMDSLELKLALRRVAKKNRIAVISAADNDTNTVINIERFDQEPSRELYHGVLGDVSTEALHAMAKSEKIGIINKMVGEKFITNRMKASLAEVGTTLHTWPQLGGAAAASAAGICFAAKRIILAGDLESGFYSVDFGALFSSA